MRGWSTVRFWDCSRWIVSNSVEILCIPGIQHHKTGGVFLRCIIHKIRFLFDVFKLFTAKAWRFVCGSENKLYYDMKIVLLFLLMVCCQNLVCWPQYREDSAVPSVLIRCSSLFLPQLGQVFGWNADTNEITGKMLIGFGRAGISLKSTFICVRSFCLLWPRCRRRSLQEMQ